MNNIINKIVVMGLGYIGLPTAAILASRGLQVIGVDINKVTVETINAGKIHIIEPDLDTIVHSVVTVGKLKASLRPEVADVFLLAVPTPLTQDKKPDVAAVRNAAKAIAPYLTKGNLVILESTSPVGTTEQVAHWLAEERADLTFPHQVGEASDISIAYCPERVLPGHILRELVENDRVIGGLTPKCAEKTLQLYKKFVLGECMLTHARTAEMVKLTENAFRDVNIAFANELSMICDQLKINVWELIKLANRHPRVNILQPGPGVGGHCIAVDPWFIVDGAPKQAKLIKTARLVNDAKPEFILTKISEIADEFDTPTIACLGLTFKADIDDLRESPALEIVEHLARDNRGTLLVVEPHIKALPKSLDDAGVELVSTSYACEQADIIVILVNHKDFYNLDKKYLADKVVIDTRGIYQEVLPSSNATLSVVS